jgi:hypothetical protein
MKANEEIAREAAEQAFPTHIPDLVADERAQTYAACLQCLTQAQEGREGERTGAEIYKMGTAAYLARYKVAGSGLLMFQRGYLDGYLAARHLPAGQGHLPEGGEPKTTEAYYADKETFIRYVADQVNPVRLKEGLSVISNFQANVCYDIIASKRYLPRTPEVQS